MYQHEEREDAAAGPGGRDGAAEPSSPASPCALRGDRRSSFLQGTGESARTGSACTCARVILQLLLLCPLQSRGGVEDGPERIRAAGLQRRLQELGEHGSGSGDVTGRLQQLMTFIFVLSYRITFMQQQM